jgi:5-methylcytosine-specific restriction endonuclease McrA
MEFTDVTRPTLSREGGRIARNVSEKTKKLVAAAQDWDCAICGNRLPATYEVDHILRLEYGGDNNVENLQALCPNCHRYKTMTESKVSGKGV